MFALSEARKHLDTKAISAVELAEIYLDRIEASRLGAFISVDRDVTLAQARAAQKVINKGRQTALTGIPMAVKDVIDVAGFRTGNGTDTYYYPVKSASIIKKLGAVVVGKTVTTENATMRYHPTVKPPKNPWDPDYWTGVSSSGSAVAIAAGLAIIALGTDKAGSIRFPCHVNGIVGLLPTPSFMMSTPFGEVGLMCRTIADMQTAFGFTPQKRVDHDVIIQPVIPYGPTRLDELHTIDTSKLLQYLTPVNTSGFASLAVPTGMQNGMPTGIQLIGKNEQVLLDVGATLEQKLWHFTTSKILASFKKLGTSLT